MCLTPCIQPAARTHHDERQQLLPLLRRGVRQRRHLEAPAQQSLLPRQRHADAKRTHACASAAGRATARVSLIDALPERMRVTGLLRNMQGVMYKFYGECAARVTCCKNIQHQQQLAHKTIKEPCWFHCCKRTLRKKLCSSQPGVWKVFVTWTKTSLALGFTAQT